MWRPKGRFPSRSNLNVRDSISGAVPVSSKGSDWRPSNANLIAYGRVTSG